MNYRSTGLDIFIPKADSRMGALSNIALTVIALFIALPWATFTAPAVAGAVESFDGIHRTKLPMQDTPAAQALIKRKRRTKS